MDKILEAEIWTITRIDDGIAVLLRPLNSEIAVPIFIGENEAQAILLGLGDAVISRPLIHDLFLKLIKRLGLDLYQVKIHDLRNSIFYSKLLLTGGESSEKKPMILDSRPSDALALAVRCKCPVFITQRVLNQAGLPVEFFLDAVRDNGTISADTTVGKFYGHIQNVPGFIARRETLQMELEQAVAAEEYEKAAEIRNVLALLDKERKDGQS
ncbi:MAG: bifunctional nuclease family protein [Treponema sp.]|jgi:bifunctional DNase/RNase|nr:bifunctional nuclease family protein [Treponema sp.]